MNKKDFYYDLPEDLIAQTPLEKRDTSRLLYINANSKQLEHKQFPDVKSLLHPGDCLVLNDSRVIPARLFGTREGLEHPVEFLLLKRRTLTDWEVIVRPGRRLKPGAHVEFIPGELSADILEILEDGKRLVRFIYSGVFEDVLDRAGEIPLPPYITKKLDDPERYQTVYSVHDGSAAAPTAGLHFTEELLAEIKAMGVNLVFVTLHVGLGTFRPVKEDNILDHTMHSEYYEVSESSCQILNQTRQRGGRIIAVGTTSCRVLESLEVKDLEILPSQGETKIFIYPSYTFKIVDCLLTNFHLPESTLLMLVSALAGKETIMDAYKEAVQEKYRFFSFGDAMFIEGKHEFLGERPNNKEI